MVSIDSTGNSVGSQINTIGEKSNLQPNLATTGDCDQNKRFVEQFYWFAHRQGLAQTQIGNYLQCILRFIRFHNKQHPLKLNQQHIEVYLSSIAKQQGAQRTSQEQAEQALTFLYQQFFTTQLSDLHYLRLKYRRGFFAKFDSKDCFGVLKNMSGKTLLMAKLALLANLKLRDIINIRLADVNLKQNQITLRYSNGQPKYTVQIPVELILELKIQHMKVQRLVQQEKEIEFADEYYHLEILANQLEPDWQYLFPMGSKNFPLNQTPLKNFKTDILIALKNYLAKFPKQTDQKQQVSLKIQNPTKKSYLKVNSKKVHSVISNKQPQQLDFNQQLGAA